MRWDLRRDCRVELCRPPEVFPDVCVVCGERSTAQCGVTLEMNRRRRTTYHDAPPGNGLGWLVDDQFVTLRLPFCGRHKAWGSLQLGGVALCCAGFLISFLVLNLGQKMKVPEEWLIIAGIPVAAAALAAWGMFRATRPMRLAGLFPKRIVLKGVSKEFAAAINREQAAEVSNAIEGLANTGSVESPSVVDILNN